MSAGSDCTNRTSSTFMVASTFYEATTLDALRCLGMVYQDVPHAHSRYCHKVRAVFENTGISRSIGVQQPR
jgi:hypothetical protein